jgi:hypothetical protein
MIYPRPTKTRKGGGHTILDIMIKQPGRKRRRVQKTRERDSNDWGQILDDICIILSVDKTYLATRAEVDPTTISRATRGDRTPSEPIMVALWENIQKVVAEQYEGEEYYTFVLDAFTDTESMEAFYNLAGHLTPAQKGSAREKRKKLETVKYYLQGIKQRDSLIDQTDKAFERSSRVVAEQKEKMEELQRALREEEQRIAALQASLEGRSLEPMQETSKDEIISAQQKEIDRLKKELDLYTRH